MLQSIGYPGKMSALNVQERGYITYESVLFGIVVWVRLHAGQKFGPARLRRAYFSRIGSFVSGKNINMFGKVRHTM